MTNAMRYTFLFVLICLQNISLAQAHKAHEEKYVLIKEVTKREDGEVFAIPTVNQKDIDRLNEPLRALAAYYSAIAQTECVSDSGEHIMCELTAALGLGEQGSEKQMTIIKKWFPDNAVVKEILANDCSVGMPGASVFENIDLLKFTIRQDTVVVNYERIIYNRGRVTSEKQTDVVLIKPGQIIFVKQHRY